MELDVIPKMVVLPVTLTNVEALALGCMLATMKWEQIRQHASDDVQAFHMRSALAAVDVALKADGYAASVVDTTVTERTPL